MFLHVDLTKGEEQVQFGQYLGKSLSVIDTSFLEYGAKDVVATYQLYHTLISKMRSHDKDGTLLSHHIQVKGELALTHIHKNGIGFDLEMKDEWLSEKNIELKYLSNKLSDWGWIRGMKGIKDRYEQIIHWLGLADSIPFKYKDEVVFQDGEKWYYKESGESLEEGKSGTRSSSREDLAPYRKHQFIGDYLDFVELEKATTFVRDVHSSRLHPRYNSLVNTGRTSCSSPNFQQLPRMGGIREMFKASEGHTLIITDYAAIELSTLAQVLLDKYGYSTMAERINDGEDLHRYYASILYSKNPVDITKDERQSAKAANFGFPGGLGLATFTTFARSYGLNITEDEAQVMKNAWFEAFPEMKRYLQEEQNYVYTLTGRKRGNTTYCAEKNTPFQGLAADGAKLALYNLDKAGFRVVGFVHDEIICEVRTEEAELLCGKMEEIMVNSMKQVVPDVKVGVESQISGRYCK
jgi:DNA polymerase I-like protein with 3'-5' exonuclease and polymerase domains